MKNTYLPGLLVAAATVALLVVGPVAAQESNQSGQGDTRTSTQQSDNSSFNPGWLGLLGLAGLAGLRKPAPTVVHQDRETVAKTY